ncbi:MAG: cobalamin-independent methionine synthase II family protein [Bradyrhizobiaceae bacterium]|nr:cobalamin-independent methionine synthase II family protein [Bradyrhizobiaceae bacterium]
MLTSRDRTLTTHVGSLPRNETITDLLIKREEGQAIDPQVMAAEMDRAVAEVVQKQIACGIDIGNDGEQQRVGFQTYMAQRMTGYGGESKRKIGRDFAEFPELTASFLRRFPKRGKISNAPQAVAEIHYKDTADIKSEIERVQKQIAAQGNKFAEIFMTAPSPGIVSTTLLNAFYDSQESYLKALAREIRKEYQAIVDAGLTLQVDAPDLAMDRVMYYQDESDAGFLKACELHTQAINWAIEGLPREKVRLHVCWGNWEGPHIYDVALSQILPILYQAKVGALSIEFSNPRHQHEYEALKKNPLPKDMILIPGVVDSTSNFVEHPEVVARRIQEAVSVVGDRERVIASTDCGFGTFAGREWVVSSVVWPKLKSLREGADIASARLWGKNAA